MDHCGIKWTWSRVKTKVSRLHKGKYTEFSNCLKECEEELGALLTGPTPFSVEDIRSFINMKQELSNERYNLRVIEDMSWRQKLRIKWLKERDLNTSFFHIMVLGSRCSILISPAMLSLGDNASMETMKVVILKVFKRRFLASTSLYIDDWTVEFLALDELIAQSL